MTTHLCGAGLAFLGFGFSLIIGLFTGNSFVTIVFRALIVLFFAYIFGCIMSLIGQKIVHDNFQTEIDAVEAVQREPSENMEQQLESEQKELEQVQTVSAV